MRVGKGCSVVAVARLTYVRYIWLARFSFLILIARFVMLDP